MTTFLAAQADWLLFANGMILVTLSVVSATLGRRRLGLGWWWLALFGGLLGFSRGLGLTAAVMGGNPNLLTIAVIVQILAFLALLQFACHGEANARGRFVAGVLVPQGAAVVVGVLQKYPGADCSSLGALQLVAGLWGAARLYWVAGQSPAGIRRCLYAAASLLGLCSLAWAIPTIASAVPTSTWPPPIVIEVISVVLQPLLSAGFLVLLVLILSDDNVAPSQRPAYTGGGNLMLWALLAVALTLVASLKLTNVVGAYGHRTQCQMLLSRVKTATVAVDHEWLTELSGSAADETRPSFHRLCERLQRVRLTNPDVRFVYLMVRREGKVIFLADSEPADSPDRSPPGQVYEEASPGLRAVFDTGEPFIEDPLVDRWGVWLSGFAPLKDSVGARTEAVLGMDVDDRLVQSEIAGHRLAGLGLSLVLNLLVLALFSGLHVNREAARAATASERRFRTMIESAPEAVFVFEAVSGRIRTVNPFMAAWLGYTQEELCRLRVQELADAPLATFQGAPGVQGVAAGPRAYRCKNGHMVPAETTGAALRFQDTDCIVAFARDVTEHLQAETELRKRGALLHGVAAATNMLLTVEQFPAAIEQALGAMGQAAGADVAYVFENHAHPATGEPAASQRFVWRSDPGAVTAGAQAGLQNVPYSRFPRWLAEFSEGRTISGAVADLPATEGASLAMNGVQSLVMVPIRIDDRLWGFIGFDDCHTQRHWTDAEVSILSAAAGSIGGAIKRREAEERLQKTLSELERFNRLMVGRETRVVELKQEVNTLLRELGRPSEYASVENTSGSGGQAPAGKTPATSMSCN